MGDVIAFEPAQAAQIIGRHAKRHGAMLPILHELQDLFGHVPRAAVPLIAEALNLSRAEVHGVVTFYHDFRDAPAGRHVVKLCQAESCQSMGSRDLARHVCSTLGVPMGGTTADGRITVEAVYCLGLCACSPSAMIDGVVKARMTAAKADRLLEALA